MSERKVLNKYYPPDFDPSKIPRRSQPKNAQQVVRLMAPFSMRCNTCGEYIYKGKKFNARKETVEGEDYYGIRIFRFYIKCTLCSAEITFKTDPKNTDYLAEHGASRNFEPWREVEVLEEEDRLAKLEEEENNPMQTLETRTTDSKREMDIMDALQDLRARNARHERAKVGDGAEQALDVRIEVTEEEEDEERRREQAEDDAIVAQYFSKVASASGSGPSSSTPPVSLPPPSTASPGADDSEGTPSTPATSAPSDATAAAPTITVKRKADFIEPDVESMIAQAAKAAMPKAATTIAAPASKKMKADRANKLGIKVKPKLKA